MPASHTKSSGVSRVDANGAKAELEEWVATNRPDLLNQTLTRPFEIIPIRTQSTSISEKFQVRNEHLSNGNQCNDLEISRKPEPTPQGS